ncbi:unnamed protein product, partial [Effrenium voratum]
YCIPNIASLTRSLCLTVVKMAPNTQVCPGQGAGNAPKQPPVASQPDAVGKAAGHVARRARKKAPGNSRAELPECFGEDFWVSPGTARIPDLERISELLSSVKAREQPKKSVTEIVAASKDQWLRRLKMGFSLLFEGVGSKWQLLEAFAESLRPAWDVACLDAFDAHATLPAFLRQLLAYQNQHRGAASLDGLVAAVLAVLQAPLVLVVHNVEELAPAHQAALSALARDPNVRLVASVDHLWAPLLWSNDMLKDFNFCREEVHTGESYDLELRGKFPDMPSWCDPFTVEVASKVSIGLVLKSLTNNHRELVEVMAKNQLEGRKEGISMPDLLAVAEDRMIASNLTKIRRLLNELTDHDIVVQRRC